MSYMSYKAQHVYDTIPSKPDQRDYRMTAVDASVLPQEVALPKVDVLDQGAEGACTGHGTAGARETLELIANGALPMTPLSRAFLYYEARLMEGTQNQDSGASVRDACKVLNQMGVCTEAEFPYTVGRFADVPTDLDVSDAAKYKIDAYTSLSNTDQIRAALAANQPVVIGIAVYPSFERVGADGLIPMPHNEPLLGYHCIFLNGYHPDPQRQGRFLIDAQNSWNTWWADGGRMHFTEDYLNDPNLTTDMYALTIVTAPPPPVPPVPSVYTDEVTGKRIMSPFLDYYRKRGGLDILGRPIAEAEVSKLPEDNGMTVQLFERARLEWHPDVADPNWRVQATALTAMLAERMGYTGLGIDGVKDIIPGK